MTAEKIDDKTVRQFAIKLLEIRRPELVREQDWNSPVSTAERVFDSMEPTEQRQLLSQVRAGLEMIELFGLVTQSDAQRIASRHSPRSIPDHASNWNM